MDLPILDMSYNCNQTICLFGMACFAQHIFKIHPSCRMYQHFTHYLQNNIPQYGCTTLLVHSSIGGHLCSFHSLAIMNNAVMYTNVQAFVGTYGFNFWHINLEMELLDHMVNVYFEELPNCVPKWLCILLFFNPISNV